MSIVDTAKARAYADALDSVPSAGDTDPAADWIHALADEVDSLQRVLNASRATTQAALAEAVRLAAERDAAVQGLQAVYDSIAAMLREARHVADTHPDPAAAGAALRILGAQ